eukprot:Clim_evm20s233 gene=Clim_evmTU20s233
MAHRIEFIWSAVLTGLTLIPLVLMAVGIAIPWASTSYSEIFLRQTCPSGPQQSCTDCGDCILFNGDFSYVDQAFAFVPLILASVALGLGFVAFVISALLTAVIGRRISRQRHLQNLAADKEMSFPEHSSITTDRSEPANPQAPASNRGSGVSNGPSNGPAQTGTGGAPPAPIAFDDHHTVAANWLGRVLLPALMMLTGLAAVAATPTFEELLVESSENSDYEPGLFLFGYAGALLFVFGLATVFLHRKAHLMIAADADSEVSLVQDLSKRYTRITAGAVILSLVMGAVVVIILFFTQSNTEVQVALPAQSLQSFSQNVLVSADGTVGVTTLSVGGGNLSQINSAQPIAPLGSCDDVTVDISNSLVFCLAARGGVARTGVMVYGLSDDNILFPIRSYLVPCDSYCGISASDNRLVVSGGSMGMTSMTYFGSGLLPDTFSMQVSSSTASPGDSRPNALVNGDGTRVFAGTHFGDSTYGITVLGRSSDSTDTELSELLRVPENLAGATQALSPNNFGLQGSFVMNENASEQVSPNFLNNLFVLPLAPSQQTSEDTGGVTGGLSLLRGSDVDFTSVTINVLGFTDYRSVRTAYMAQIGSDIIGVAVGNLLNQETFEDTGEGFFVQFNATDPANVIIQQDIRGEPTFVSGSRPQAAVINDSMAYIGVGVEDGTSIVAISLIL